MSERREQAWRVKCVSAISLSLSLQPLLLNQWSFFLYESLISSIIYPSCILLDIIAITVLDSKESV